MCYNNKIRYIFLKNNLTALKSAFQNIRTHSETKLRKQEKEPVTRWRFVVTQHVQSYHTCFVMLSQTGGL